jgi:hypothetical protein
MTDGANVARITEALGAEGIAPERLTLLGGAPHGEFLGRYNGIDLALDTFPYSGGLDRRPPDPETVLPNVDVPPYAVDGLRPEHQLNQRQPLT